MLHRQHREQCAHGIDLASLAMRKRPLPPARFDLAHDLVRLDERDDLALGDPVAGRDLPLDNVPSVI
jgi:hypothetical protein